MNLQDIGVYFSWFILIYMLVVISFYSVVMLISVIQLRKE